MTQGAIDGTIGISIRDTILRMTEVSHLKGETKITRLSQGRVRTPLLFSSFRDPILARKYAEDINRLYEIADFRAQSAVFTLDSSLVLIKRIPIDASLKGQQLKDHINWEVEQSVINSADRYIIDYEYVDAADEGYAEVIVVIVRKTIIDFLLNVFKITDIKLVAVDVDVFAAQRTFLWNYETVNNDYIALVDLREGGLQISIIKKSEFILVQDIDLAHSKSDISTSANSEDLSKFLSKELRRIILDNKLGDTIDEIGGIYIYGEMATDRIIETLQSMHNVRISLTNPFLKINPIDQFDDPSLQQYPEKFVTSVGAALKELIKK